MNYNGLTKQDIIYDILKCNSNLSSEVKGILNATDYESVFENHIT